MRLLARITTSAPSAFGNLLASVHLRHAGITEVALPGDQPEMLRELRRRWLPTVVLAWGERYDSPYGLTATRTLPMCAKSIHA